MLCRHSIGEDNASSLQEKDCVFECKRCVIQHKIRTVLSQSRYTEQPMFQHAASPAVTTGHGDLLVISTCLNDTTLH